MKVENQIDYYENRVVQFISTTNIVCHFHAIATSLYIQWIVFSFLQLESCSFPWNNDMLS